MHMVLLLGRVEFLVERRLKKKWVMRYLEWMRLTTISRNIPCTTPELKHWGSYYWGDFLPEFVRINICKFIGQIKIS